MDWKTIITDIKAGLGMTQVQIAAKVGCSQVAVSELETGRTKEPAYKTGSGLMALHKKAKRRKQAQAA